MANMEVRDDEVRHWVLVWAALSQEFGEFNLTDLLSIFNSRDHPFGVAVCQC